MNEYNIEKPITYDELCEKIKDNYKVEELDLINKAYMFALDKHKDKYRLNGEPYITHPLEVANILVDLNVDYITIMCALLHETVNHTEATLDEIEEQFGSEVKRIVSSISKINRLEYKDSAAQYLRKVLVGLSEDVRVLFIKLADRLHNMRTLYALPLEEQKQKANETISVLIPIAHRLGINSLKSELEDLCLKYLKPDVYNDILERLDASREELNELLQEMKESLSEILTENGINFKIKGRVKSVHSLYNKMDNGKRFSDIYDILALRVFVDTVQDCYLTIGLIHSKFRPMPRRFKDYVANPKENMYQSLHTTVFGPQGQLFEVQVRTYEMDEIAEKGIASHWSYKEKGSVKIQSMMERKLEMFRNTIESNNYVENDTEFANTLNNEFLVDLIYCYTPKGDVLELPRGATPIDFAYRIHSGVGDKTIRACVSNEEIENQIVPLNYELHDGDMVRIDTDKNATPNKEWLKFVKTSQARNKIKAYFSKQERIKYIEKGKELLENAIHHKKLSYNEVYTDENINKILQDTHNDTLDDLYLSIGSLRFTPTFILELITKDKKEVEDPFLGRKGTNPGKQESDILIGQTSMMMFRLAKCCKPVRGDDIIGYITRGEGVTIHRIECPNVKDTPNIINATWNSLEALQQAEDKKKKDSTVEPKVKTKNNQDNSKKRNGTGKKNNNVPASKRTYLTDVLVTAYRGQDLASDIEVLAQQKDVFVNKIDVTYEDDKAIYKLLVKVKNKEELEKFMTSLNNISGIKNVERTL